MTHFTQKELGPSKRTIDFIKQFAYTYRTVKINGRTEALCLN